VLSGLGVRKAEVEAFVARALKLVAPAAGADAAAEATPTEERPPQAD
jgi:hypothetical protein